MRRWLTMLRRDPDLAVTLLLLAFTPYWIWVLCRLDAAEDDIKMAIAETTKIQIVLTLARDIAPLAGVSVVSNVYFWSTRRKRGKS